MYRPIIGPACLARVEGHSAPMLKLEQLVKGLRVRGVIPDQAVTVVDATAAGDNAVELTYKDAAGRVASQILLRAREGELEPADSGPGWTFDADPKLFKLITEAHRIRMGYLFDPHLAVTTSLVDPLPHQIMGVYGEILQRQPLRYLLADDPGAGKTIMAGLLMKELIARGVLRRCLVCCPGSLAEQWQDELHQKFRLNFKIISRETIANALEGNPFKEFNLVISRLDLMSRNDDVKSKLKAAPEWDLVVCDEAHKMSASVFGREIKRTKRYELGQLLSGLTRHLLLLTATPHNGKDADFQLFMALLDPDRFEGRYRPDVHQNDVHDLMRRMVKEDLVKFDGTPLFPERRAYTVRYELSPLEAQLYRGVTAYVRDEFNRAERLQEGRRGTVGFALTSLQRRLASSPEAIYQSLRRRKERLERRLAAERTGRRPDAELGWDPNVREMTEDDIEDIEEMPDAELEGLEQTVTDQATAARTMAELEAEISTLEDMQALAEHVRTAGTDRKWEQLSGILQDRPEMFDDGGRRRKLVLFTEHLDTLRYLERRISTLLGRPEVLVTIHGGMSRDARREAQLKFTQDRDVALLIATDAAGEGINLQRAHLMVNYDLPWNPNRLEQRFGRIHRIGQTEVCHLWNLVAADTREGEVFDLLLSKLERAREALGGRDSVYDVLGRVFKGTELRDLLIEAIRYGEKPEVKARLLRQVEQPLDVERIKDLLEEHALARDAMDASKLQRIREEMERAEAQKLQPHYIGSFFREAFKLLGGSMYERETDRWEVTHVPTPIRVREAGVGGPILQRYERITFKKELINVPEQAVAEYVCPGHPLLEATMDVLLDRHPDVLSKGTILVDESDSRECLRLLSLNEHTIARGVRDGVLSRRLQFVELDQQGNLHLAGPAPHLNCEPAADDVRGLIADRLAWVGGEAATRLRNYAVTQLVPAHVEEVQQRQEEMVRRTMAAVQDRLTKEIAYWDRRAEELRAQAAAGRQPRMNPQRARERADELRDRLRARMEELRRDLSVVPRPPVTLGAALVVPGGMLRGLRGEPAAVDEQARRDLVERLAMEAVMAAERGLGFEPRDVSALKIGYDVESRDPRGGPLRFIEVKGRAQGADTVTITRNEVTVGLNSPERFVLALAFVEGERVSELVYVRRPFRREPDFGVTSLNYEVRTLLQAAEKPT